MNSFIASHFIYYMRLWCFNLLLLLFIGCKKEIPVLKTEMVSLPEDAALIIQIPNYSKFVSSTSENELINLLGPQFKGLKINLTQTPVKEWKGRVYLSIKELTPDDWEISFLGNPDGVTWDPTYVVRDSLSYESHTITKWTNQSTTHYTTNLSKYLAISSSQLILENLIRNLDDEPKNPSLMRLLSLGSVSNSPVIFINPSKLKPFYDILYPEEWNLPAKNTSDWQRLEINMMEEELKLQGVGVAQDTLGTWSSLFAGMEPHSLAFQDIMPQEAVGGISFSYDRYVGFKDRILLMSDKANSGSYSSKNDQLFEKTDELGIITLPDATILTIHCVDPDEVMERLSPVSSEVGNYKNQMLYSLEKSHLLRDNFPLPQLNGRSFTYYTLLGAQLVFTEKQQSLEYLITQFLNNATVGEDPRYQNLISALTSSCSFRIIAISPSFFVDKSRLVLSEESSKKFSDYPYFITQYTSDSGFGHWLYYGAKPKVAISDKSYGQISEIELDGKLGSPPQWVINHITNEQEIVVQDQNHHLYLLSKEGKILWKKDLGNPILGKIQQVDLFRNGRLQLAFVTKDRFLVLDRNGKEVSPFNLKLSAPATQPLAVFDYDNNKDYRFVITQEDLLTMFDRNLKRVTGFQLDKVGSPLINPPKHLRELGKDYVILQQSDGTLRILDRRGKDRIRPSKKLNFSSTPVYWYQESFVTYTKEGSLALIDTKGRVTLGEKNIEPISMQVYGNNLIILSGNTLTIQDKKVELTKGTYSEPILLQANEQLYLALLDDESQKCYVFDKQGNLILEFPITNKGESAICYDQNENGVLLATKGEEDTVLIYRLKL